VKLVAKVSLKPTPEQADALIRTMQTTNAACDWLSEVAFEQHLFHKFALQKAVYHP